MTTKTCPHCNTTYPTSITSEEFWDHARVCEPTLKGILAYPPSAYIIYKLNKKPFKWPAGLGDTTR